MSINVEEYDCLLDECHRRLEVYREVQWQTNREAEGDSHVSINVAEYDRLLDEYHQRLEVYREVRRQTNREIARDFNIISVGKSVTETDFSGFFYDFLNPKGTHGQGDIFLRKFMEAVDYNALTGSGVTVEREYGLEGRRIDVLIDFNRQAGIGIENKPWASDLDDQLKVYDVGLSRKYPGKYLLVYLTGSGKAPSENSITLAYLKGEKDSAGKPIPQEKQRGKKPFKIVSYLDSIQEADDDSEEAESDKPDEWRDFRCQKSLDWWLDQCHNLCQAEKVRYFLHDMCMYIQNTIPRGNLMQRDEQDIVERYLLEDKERLRKAVHIGEAYLALKSKAHASFKSELIAAMVAKFEKRGYKVELHPGGRRAATWNQILVCKRAHPTWRLGKIEMCVGYLKSQEGSCSVGIHTWDGHKLPENIDWLENAVVAIEKEHSGSRYKDKHWPYCIPLFDMKGESLADFCTPEDRKQKIDQIVESVDRMRKIMDESRARAKK